MRKIFTLLILLLLLPVTALAAGDAPAVLYVGNYQITNTSGTTYLKAGSTRGSLEEGSETDWTVKYAPTTATLTLKDAKISGSFHQYNNPFTAGIYALCSSNQPVALTIELIGTNTITGHYGIYVDAQQGQTVGTNASLLIQNSSDNGILEVSGSSDGIYVKSGTGNASLTINDASVVAKTTQTYSGGHAGVYVQSSAYPTSPPQLSLAVNGGSLTTSASEGNDGIQFNVGSFQATGATTSLTVTNHAIVDARNGGISASRTSITLPTPTPSGENSSGIVFDGNSGTVYGDVTLDESLTINQGETLTIGKDASLNANGNLINNGTINVESGGTVTGSLSGGSMVTTPSISAQPTGQTVTEGSAAEFSVTASDAQTYQWQQSTDNGSSWTDISGATSADYTTETTTTSMDGYQYRCVVKSASGVSVISQAATLTVQAKPASVPVTDVSLDKDTLSLYTGDTASLTATVEPDNATNQNVTWSSDNADVATVDNGTVTAVGAGEATITVTTEDGSKTATCTVTVTVPVTGVKLNKETLELFTDGSETLTATVQPSDATNQNVTWSSDKPEVATVDNGKVTAVGAGEATITATAGGITATCVVHVRKPATVEASGSTNLSFTTDRNEFTLTAIVYGENLSQEPNCWEWTVANTDVVSLSDTPNLRSGSVASSRKAFTIKGTGTTTITATYDDGTYRGSVDFKVRISKPTPPDPISYYNIYVEDVCDGVEVTLSNNVVREGNSISVYVKKDTVNYTFDNFKVYYKRSYYGTWDELKEGTQPGEYPIKNIWTHIYIKAEGAEEKEDPTGIESIEGVKVYTKDGSLYVQTPQREQVIIVSMSGAVVKNEEQIGLKQYHGLQPGIYIVRVGDRAYKVRLN